MVRPQKLVVNPRGNQLATVGVIETRLCPACDADVLRSTHEGHWLPDGYASRFVNGFRPVAGPAVRRPVGDGHRPAGPMVPERPLAPIPRPTAVPPASAPAPLSNPTVRQAVEASMKDHPDLNAGVLALLALHLGPATRLDALGDAVGVPELRRWRDKARLPATADATIGSLRADWEARGWVGNRAGTLSQG